VIEQIIQVISDKLVDLNDLPEVLVKVYPRCFWVEGLCVGLASNTQSAKADSSGRTASLTQLLSGFKSQDPNDRALAVAAMNSVANTTQILSQVQTVNAFELLRKRGKDLDVSVFGSFPATQDLKQDNSFRSFQVYELAPKEDEVAYSEFARSKNKPDVLLLTATSLINGTFWELQPRFRDTYVMLVGPSTPLLDVFFTFGVDALCGTIVTDKVTASQSFQKGLSFREAQGLKFVTWLKSQGMLLK
jgi:uncharacterized protein (DUF4213/DUF364 family)